MAKETSNRKVRLGKKKLYSLIASIVLVIVIVAFAAYYWESRTNIAKITQFSKTEGQIPDQVFYRFSAKVENQGTNDINGLTLRVRILGDGIQIGGEDYPLSSLLRGQEFTSDDLGVWVNITDIGSKTITFAATLDLDNKKIDEVILTS